jgi:hypothetical protein
MVQRERNSALESGRKVFGVTLERSWTMRACSAGNSSSHTGSSSWSASPLGFRDVDEAGLRRAPGPPEPGQTDSGLDLAAGKRPMGQALRPWIAVCGLS